MGADAASTGGAGGDPGGGDPGADPIGATAEEASRSDTPVDPAPPTGDGALEDGSDEVAEVDPGNAGGFETGHPELEGQLDEAAQLAVDIAGERDQLRAERDEYLDLARRVQADFENYKRRTDLQRSEQAALAAERLIRDLLPVLDACDAARSLGASDVDPIHASLVGVLDRQGLIRIDEAGSPFDPEQHEAVMTAEGEGDATVVLEVLRTGYRLGDKVIRPAMVKVSG